MAKWILFLLCLWTVSSSSTSPLSSKLGDSFRSGEAIVNIGDQTSYDFNVPYLSPLSGDSVVLALSMLEYKQTFDNSLTINYILLEDTPSPSNGTNAVFRVELNLNTLTSKAKVRYLSSVTSILSINFNIVILDCNPGRINGGSSKEFTLSTPLNASSDNYYTEAIWMSGITASKFLAGYWFSIGA